MGPRSTFRSAFAKREGAGSKELRERNLGWPAAFGGDPYKWADLKTALTSSLELIALAVVLPATMLASPYHKGIPLPRIPVSRELHPRDDYLPQ